MTDNDFMFATPPAPTVPAGATACPPKVSATAKQPKAAVCLDMGEASREQGFRANGCR